MEMNGNSSEIPPVVVIADLIGSRFLTDRDAFQQRLIDHLAHLCAQGHLLSPYTLTLGDEFQAVLPDLNRGLRDWIAILAHLAPVKARFVWAAGPLSTRINPVAALQMDGPSFAEARRLMEILKRRKVLCARIGWALPGPPPLLANAALAQLAATMDGWKPVTFRLLLHLLDGRSAEESAKQLGMTLRGVHKHVASRHLHEVRDLLTHTAAALDDARRRHGDAT